jgi:hypothetical protein
MIEIDTDGINYYEAKDVAKLLMEINIIVKIPLVLTISDINMEREISDQCSNLLYP